MTKQKSTFGLIAVLTVMATTIITLSTGFPLNAQAQNTSAPQSQQATQATQINGYLTEAIQAVNTGDNIRALQQVNLAEDQLRALTGNIGGDDDDDDDDD